MRRHADETRPRERKCIFYCGAVALFLVAVGAAFVQKRHESAVAIIGAARAAGGPKVAGAYEKNARQSIDAAERWRTGSLAAVALGILSWWVAVRRREKCWVAWAGVIVLLSLAVALQVMMV